MSGVLENSDIGILYSEARSENNIQGVLGIDGTLRTQELHLASQFAKSDSGYAKFVQLDLNIKNFFAHGKFEKFDKHFDIEKIGYLAWMGNEKKSLILERRFFNIKIFRMFGIACGGQQIKEAQDPGTEYSINGWVGADFYNNWSFSCNFYKGRGYEVNKWYDYAQAKIDIWNNYSKPFFVWGNIWYKSYGFNYRRNYFARMGTNNIYLEMTEFLECNIS